MRIFQYCYFGMNSYVVTASEITAGLFIEPDRVMVRGSKRTEPREYPVCHGWYVECRDRNSK